LTNIARIDRGCETRCGRPANRGDLGRSMSTSYGR